MLTRDEFIATVISNTRTFNEKQLGSGVEPDPRTVALTKACHAFTGDRDFPVVINELLKLVAPEQGLAIAYPPFSQIEFQAGTALVLVANTNCHDYTQNKPLLTVHAYTGSGCSGSSRNYQGDGQRHNNLPQELNDYRPATDEEATEIAGKFYDEYLNPPPGLTDVQIKKLLADVSNDMKELLGLA